MATETLAKRLHEVFGGVRAEYFHDDLYALFTEPNYWPELRTARPCFLVGGRGTGKTTVLRGLSFRGQEVLEGPKLEAWQHIGLYWRIDTNVVSAFRGGSVGISQWTRIFGHYANLRLLTAIAEFLEWAPEHLTVQIDDLTPDFSATCAALSIAPAVSIADFTGALRTELLKFENAVNNIDDGELPPLSIQGRPIQELVRALERTAALQGKTYYFLVDEYENLLDYQQRCLNTLVKHTGDSAFTFKIGVKETGHRERTTINSRESLVEPADYATIDITKRLKDRDFSRFAEDVCRQRISRISELEAVDIRDLLPGVSMEEEIRVLGGETRSQRLAKQLGGESLDQFNNLNLTRQVFAGYWAESRDTPLAEVVAEMSQHEDQWRSRLNNYAYAMLFTLRRGLPGMKKLYSGFETFAALADGNIRFLLQLVGEALQAQIDKSGDLSGPIDAVVQTVAAQQVGLKAVKNLPGASADGAQITKLVLSLGRVFGVMASHPEGHAPEVNQFRLDGRDDEWASRILDAGIMHLALTRFPGNKNASYSGETREWDYQLHPIFAPFFVYSHRRKRRMSISPRTLRWLVESPGRGIESVLEQSDRRINGASELPEQLTLFEGFYGVN